MHLVCLDLEGVLLPEFWIAVAEATGIDALRRTTRDEPDYDTLMRYRLALLDKHELTLPRLYDAIKNLHPLPGASEFVNWLQTQTRLVILSDTFLQFSAPLMAQLGHPTLFCHELKVGADGRISDYLLRQKDHKRRAVEAFKTLNFKVIAAGDSYNDVTMLKAADTGILYSPPQNVIDDFPEFPVTRTYDELKAELLKVMEA